MRFTERDPENLPFVSVIVPVYNDPNGVKITIKSLLAQSYPSEKLEFLIVDNGSKDRTREVIKQFDNTNEEVTLLIENDIQSSYAARNRGIRNSQGSILAFIDADMTAVETWLERGVEEMRSRNCEYLGGAVDLYTDGRESIATKYDRNVSFANERFIEQHEWSPTCNLFVRRRVFEDLGLFDARLVSGGDLEFGNRVAASGRSLCFSPNARAHHPTCSTLTALSKKYARYGRGHQQLRRYFPDRYGHPLLSFFNLKRWVPRYPWAIPQLCRNWKQLSRTERLFVGLTFYFLHQLAMPYGEIEEGWADVVDHLHGIKK